MDRRQRCDYFSLLLLLPLFALAGARPVSFLEDFRVYFAGTHIRQMEGGSAVQLMLDPASGCGFSSKKMYHFGRVSVKIKLIPGDSAGTVTAFYMNSDTDSVRDELDIEFLGNRTGQPYTVQTNVYAHGKGDREQRVNLWFDPSREFHNYSITWNRRQVLFAVDDVPIRVYKNNEAVGVAYPTAQPMRVYSSLWEGDDWATRGGLEKIDWSKAPFYACYKDFDIEGCAVVPGADAAACVADPRNWWEAPEHRQLSPEQARKYRWVRTNFMIYDYLMKAAGGSEMKKAPKKRILLTSMRSADERNGVMEKRILLTPWWMKDRWIEGESLAFFPSDERRWRSLEMKETVASNSDPGPLLL